MQGLSKVIVVARDVAGSVAGKALTKEAHAQGMREMNLDLLEYEAVCCDVLRFALRSLMLFFLSVTDALTQSRFQRSEEKMKT